MTEKSHQFGFLPKRFTYKAPAAGAGSAESSDEPAAEKTYGSLGEHPKLNHLKSKAEDVTWTDSAGNTREEIATRLKRLKDESVDNDTLRSWYPDQLKGEITPAALKGVREKEIGKLKNSVSDDVKGQFERILDEKSKLNFDNALKALKSDQFSKFDEKGTVGFVDQLNLRAKPEFSSARLYLETSDKVSRLQSELSARKQALIHKESELEAHKAASDTVKNQAEEWKKRKWKLVGPILKTAGIIAAVGAGGGLFGFSTTLFTFGGLMNGAGTVLGSVFTGTFGKLALGSSILGTGYHWADKLVFWDKERQYNKKTKALEQEIEDMKIKQTKSEMLGKEVSISSLESELSEAQEQLKFHEKNVAGTYSTLDDHLKHYRAKRNLLIQNGKDVDAELENGIKALEVLKTLYSVNQKGQLEKLVIRREGSVSIKTAEMMSKLVDMNIDEKRFDKILELMKRQDEEQKKTQKELLELPYELRFLDEIQGLDDTETTAVKKALEEIQKGAKATVPSILGKAPTVHTALTKLNDIPPEKSSFRVQMASGMLSIVKDEIELPDQLKEQITKAYGTLKDYAKTSLISPPNVRRRIVEALDNDPEGILNEANKDIFKIATRRTIQIPKIVEGDFEKTLESITDTRDLRIILACIKLMTRRGVISEKNGKFMERDQNYLPDPSKLEKHELEYWIPILQNRIKGMKDKDQKKELEDLLNEFKDALKKVSST